MANQKHRGTGARPKTYIGAQRGAKKTVYNNSSYGRGASRNYASNRYKDDEYDPDAYDEYQTEIKRPGQHPSDNEDSDPGDSNCYCPDSPTPDSAGNNEAGGSVAETANQISNMTLVERRCMKCYMCKQVMVKTATEKPVDEPNVEAVVLADDIPDKNPKKKKKRQRRKSHKKGGGISGNAPNNPASKDGE